ncbi:MAG: TolC family protein, partial [Candidatus Omnitrophica bacterium]|nr:TolC family protein [Candidatus Omnitrophota bacterium]
MKKIILFSGFLLLAGGELWAMARKPPVEEPVQETVQPPPVVLSLGLWDCFDLAMKRSETLAISKEEIGRTLGSFLEASGEAIGDFDFQMTERRQDPQKGGGQDGNFAFYERRERKFVYSQPIFQGFRALGALSGAGSLKKQKTNEWERAKQILFMDVVDAFYEYLRLERDIEVIEGILNLFGERIKELKGWEDIGRTRTS